MKVINLIVYGMSLSFNLAMDCTPNLNDFLQKITEFTKTPVTKDNFKDYANLLSVEIENILIVKENKPDMEILKIK